ncbi:hypothetical protein [Nocardioides sp. KR10-350]|uniref:hypothetical protein n=1 Tax=Nocardioides cheoyonin TaxID=3156615 RepID=UPI0032B5C773
MTEPTDQQLEQVLRAGLQHLAGEPDVTVPVADRARTEAVRRRRHARRSRLVGGAAAAAVVAVVAGTLAVVDGRDDGSPTPAASEPADAGPAGFRLEVWHDVMVYVPSDWGWGAAPPACGVDERVGADGHRRTPGEAVHGYVGRPVSQIPRCPTSTPGTQPLPTAPYVWLGSNQPTGTVELGGGWTQETIAVGDETVTVATRDDTLRRQILDSAAPAHGQCSARLDSPPVVGSSAEDAPLFSPQSMTVCAYAADASMSHYDLLYEQSLESGPAKQLADAVAAAKPLGEYSCYAARGGEWALLRLSSGPAHRDYVVDLSCPSIAAPDGTQHELTAADVLPWAVDGVNAVLHAPAGVKVPGRFVPSY